jgi:hypothetical protein
VPILRKIFTQQFRIAVNNSQQIVEIMRHSTRQPADGFHFLRLKELLFQMLVLGNILRDADVLLQTAVLILHWNASVRYPTYRAIGSNDAVFVFVRFPVFLDFHIGHYPFPIVGIYGFNKRLGVL